MAKTRSRIRFNCGNCTQPLEARRSQAGSPMRCPWCLSHQTVPQESRDLSEPEQYLLRPPDAPVDAEAESRSYVPVICGLCRTRMYATPQQVGQKIVCPDCGTGTVVRPAPPEKPLVLRPAQAANVEIYNVHEGLDQPPATDKAAHGKYIPVICGVCRTRMLATEDQVGRELVCPDCSTRSRVPPPAEVSEPDRPDVTQAGEYALTGMDQPAPGSPAHQRQFAFSCPVCRTRMQAGRNEAGREVRCPDCLATFAVPEPPPEIAEAGLEEGVEPYRMAGGPVETPPVLVRGFAPVVGDRPLQPLSEDEGGDTRESLLPRRQAVPLPPWPFVKGVFSFPFYRTSWPRWLGLTMGGTVFGFFAGAAAWFALAGGVAMILAVILGGLTGGIGFVWFAWASIACLTIVVDTAGGQDAIDDWHQDEWLDRFFDGLYLVSGLLCSAVLGLAADRGLVLTGLPQGAGVLIAEFLTYPVLVLAMLETGSPWNPFSGMVWGSLFTAWRGWVAFYLLSGPLLVALLVAVTGLLRIAGLFALAVLPVPLVTGMMIYYRLLGRLGLYCTDRIARQQKP